LHCLGNYPTSRKELTLEEWKKVIDELVQEEVFYINISGGEPTISPFFKQFLKYLNYKGLHFILTTNGIFSAHLRKFISEQREYLIGIKFSLDGYDATSFAYLRNTSKRNFNRVMQNIIYFKSNKIPITIATTLHQKNIVKFQRYLHLIRKIKPISWLISPIIPVGRGRFIKRINYEFFSKDFWDSIMQSCEKEKINIQLIDLPYKFKDIKKLDYYECGATITFCEINADGTVAPCTLARVGIPKKVLKFENIKKKRLKEIWNGKAFQRFRNFMTEGCKGCKAFDKCYKCVAQSFIYFSRGDFPTPYCIASGERLGLKNLKRLRKILQLKSNTN